MEPHASAHPRSPRFLDAFYLLDPHLAKQPAALSAAGTPELEAGWRGEARRDKRDDKASWKEAIRLGEKLAQLEKSGEDYVFDPRNNDEFPDRNENASPNIGD
jgi:hypothetical protein